MKTLRQCLRSSRFVYVVWAVVLTSGYAVNSAVAQGNVNRADLLIGALKRISVPGAAVTKVEVSDSALATARVSGDNTVTLIGLKKGIATVTIYQDAQCVDYIVATWNTLPENIKSYLNDIPGVEFDVNGAQLLIKGPLLLQSDKERVDKIAEVFADDIKNVTYHEPHMWKQETIKRVLKEVGNPHIQAHFIEDNLILTGKVHREEDKLRAETVAQAYVGKEGSVSDSIQVIDLPVQIDAAFVQLTTVKGHEIGADEGNLGILQGPSLELNLKADEGDAIGSSLQVGSIGYGLANQTLKYLQSNGRAKILKRPYVRTNSGKPGRIQQGGEIGVKTTSTTGAGGVDYKEYGLILDITPVVGPDYEDITLEMSLEVSQPIQATSGADVEFQKFSTSAYGTVKLGETLVVSGLKQMVRERMRDNVPILGDIPLLNLLFARDELSDQQTDIVVLFTPYLPETKRAIPRTTPAVDAPELYRKADDPDMGLNRRHKGDSGGGNEPD